MEKIQVASILNILDEKNTNGQFIGVILRTQSGFSAGAKNAGYWKVTKFTGHNWVKTFQELVNTSSGLTKAGIEYPELDESRYSKIDANGLFVHLNSDHEKWYVRMMFNENSPKPTTVFVDMTAGKEITPEECLTPSALKKYRGEIKITTEKGELLEKAKVTFRNISIENIVQFSISGNMFVDESLKHYLQYVKK